MQKLKKLLFLLNPRERRQAGMLLSLILTMAVMETLGVASILPFIAVLSNPDLIHTNFMLSKIFQASAFLGIDNTKEFLVLLGISVFIILLFSLIIKSLTVYLQARFVEMREYSIGKRLIEGYLHQPYSWFLNRHSADLGKNILSEVQQVINGAFNPMFELISRSSIAIAITSLLMIVDLKLAIIVGTSLSVSYVLIFKYIYKYLRQIGNSRLLNNQSRFTTVNEAFSAAKEVKIGGLEQAFINKFSESAFNYAKSQAALKILSQIPRHAIEIIAFGGIMLIILYLILQFGNFDSALPIISLYVFAGYRLIPAFQYIYQSLSQLTYHSLTIDKLYYDLKSLKQITKNQDQNIILLKKSINLKNINFNYPNAKKTSLTDINMKIDAKSTVGLIGPTGCGKTTTVDIIMGLLEPEKGVLEVDGQIISKTNLRSWQKSIGYVPQNIYLSDDTVSSNIAFGIPFKEINHEAVKKAAKIANLHNYIINELPNKYDTTIGERGIRLSGGQRQRIGIARAIYHEPKVLIMDEATSSLDNETEKAVMDAVNALGKNITIIIIAHRLNTVKDCDIIYKLDNGQILSKGSYQEILK